MRETRRQGDERAHDGQHAAEEDRLEPVAVEPVLRDIDMMLLDEEIAAVAIDERTPAIVADGIGKERARHAADHASRERGRIAELPVENQIACKA